MSRRKGSTKRWVWGTVRRSDDRPTDRPTDRPHHLADDEEPEPVTVPTALMLCGAVVVTGAALFAWLFLA